MSRISNFPNRKLLSKSRKKALHTSSRSRQIFSRNLYEFSKLIFRPKDTTYVDAPSASSHPKTRSKYTAGLPDLAHLDKLVHFLEPYSTTTSLATCVDTESLDRK